MATTSRRRGFPFADHHPDGKGAPTTIGAMRPSVPAGPAAASADVPTDDVIGSSAAGPAALRGSAIRSLGYATTVLLSLVSAPLLIRHLGIAAFGRYTTVIALVTIVGGLTDGGLLSIALREWATRTGEDRATMLRGLLGIRLELTAAGVLVGVLFALLAGYPNPMVLGALIAGIGIGLQVIANLVTVALQGDLRFGWATVIDITRQSVSTVLIVVLVILGAGLVPFFGVTIPSGLAALGLTAVLARRRMPLVPKFRGDLDWSLLRDTLPYAAAIAVSTLYFRVTIVVMSLIASPRQTGYFATSFRVTEVLVGVPAIAVGAAFPVLARAAREDDKQRFAYAARRIFELAMVAGVGVALVIVLIAPFAVRVLAGPSGAPAVPVLQIQGLSLIATFIAAASAFLLLSVHRNKSMLIASCAAFVTNLVLTCVLVPIDQAEGAAIAAVIAEACMALVQTVLLLRLGYFRLDIRSLALIVLAGAIAAAPLLIGGLASVAQTAVGAIIYVAALAAFRRLPPELWQIVRHHPPDVPPVH